MREYPVPTDSQISDWFVRLLFNNEPSYLTAAIRLAYRDLSRTIHGIAGHDPNGALRNNASQVLFEAIRSVGTSSLTSDAFDGWHKATSDALLEVYRIGGFPHFVVGQAQKWINMATKYCALLGDRAVPSGRHFFRVGHVPVDSFLISALAREDPPLPVDLRFEAWSRLTSYEQYMCFQQWVRKAYSPFSPLAVEFYLWQEEASARANAT